MNTQDTMDTVLVWERREQRSLGNVDAVQSILEIENRVSDAFETTCDNNLTSDDLNYIASLMVKYSSRLGDSK